jgi:hypothetical protein
VYTIETKHENIIGIGIVEALVGTTLKGTSFLSFFCQKKTRTKPMVYTSTSTWA